MKTYIIAEAGVNHNGDVNLAKQLIDIAVEAKADAVKFQTFIPELGISKYAPKAEYQNKNLGQSISQFDMVKSLELSFDEHLDLYNYCKEKKITYLSTAFDIPSIEFLSKLVPMFKIPSGEITNLPYLRCIAQKGKNIILSTGMSNIDEINQAIGVLTQYGLKKNQITLLHCTTQYPCPIQDVNLKAMITLEKTFDISVGYSDHTLGIEISIAAVAMGASIIEKHFTLSRDLAGPDHRASLEPSELNQLVRSIRCVENSMGDGIKVPSESEKENISIARKSIVAKEFISKGTVLTEDNITCKRPGNGISPMVWDSVIGKKAIRDFESDDLIHE